MARLARGLSHPFRVEIVRMLASRGPEDPCICSDIVRAMPLAQSSVSQHLRVLRETGWITGRPQGTSVHYCLNEGVIAEFRDLLAGVRDAFAHGNATVCMERMTRGHDSPKGDIHVRGDGKGN